MWSLIWIIKMDLINYTFIFNTALISSNQSDSQRSRVVLSQYATVDNYEKTLPRKGNIHNEIFYPMLPDTFSTYYIYVTANLGIHTLSNDYDNERLWQRVQQIYAACK